MRLKILYVLPIILLLFGSFLFQSSSVLAQNCAGGGVGGCVGGTGNDPTTHNGNDPTTHTGNDPVTPGGNAYVPLQNPINAANIQALVAAILVIVVKIGAPIILFFLIYVGFLFATARGNEKKLTDAKRALVWTLIGGLIILGAQALASIIESTINQIWHG